ncbi:TIGR02234 family membrane protein [Corynebacterium lehmanniae]|uniref:TIGR02234 family membrane protein n=1 Tax=Corynebacterium haemomassiliense TaxID=2754726 RepID=UPI00370D44EF
MTTAAKPDKKAARKGALALGVAGALSWISSRMAWVRAEFVDDISGGGEATVNGADWSTETGAIAVLLLAGMVAAFALRRLGRRVIGAICTAASFGLAVPAVRLLLGGADPERVHALLTAGADEAQQGNSAPAIAQWADITSATTLVAGPGLALAAALLGLAGGVLLIARPGEDSPRQNKYEKETVRREKVREDLEEDPQSGRVLWDAISADIDPTDPQSGPDFRSSKSTR